MHTQLRETVTELADVLWREHTVYRERGGGVVIRGEHVQRWISLAPSGGRDEVLVRAGRILDGGTTAPARSEIIVSLTVGTSELAAICRRLLADTAADTTVPPQTRRNGRPTARAAKPARRPKGRHTSLRSWVVILCIAAVVGLYVHSVTNAPY
ncbi:hypothetical protein ACH44C_15750 [Streptomyces purpureus]|uniref:hypothetical protein n=1 Tax=Streptomyces purpureus TaxID=1951 RepID=UPI00378A3825